MSALTTAILAAGFVFAGAILGLLLYRVLPEHHLKTETRDTVRLGIGMLSVLASLVLGLLTASAKGTFDRADQQIRSYAGDLILLDQTLRNYGPQTRAIRDILRQYTADAVHTTWPDDDSVPQQPLENKEYGALLDRAMRETLSLSPMDENQRWLHNQALKIGARLIQTRWALLLGAQGAISPILIGIMVVWVFIIFASFGLNAPRNATVIGAFFLCALSIGASIFVILEMNAPFDGYIMVSSAPMKDALAHLDAHE